MATHGRLGDFDSTQEDWESYVERLELYFTANDVSDAGKVRAIFLSTCGAATYRLIKSSSVLAPKKPTEVDFKDIVAQMSAHYHPTPAPTVQRFRFNSRSRKPGESIATFVSELKKLSEYCEFGESLDEMIRDRLVCGIADERWQRRMLSEPKLDFKKAFELAQAMEAAERNVRDLQSATTQEKLHALHLQSQDASTTHRTPPSRCYRCGANHKAADCRFKDTECHYCHKKGHIAKVCRSKTRDFNRKPPRSPPPRKGSTHHVDEETEAPEYMMYHTPAASSSPLLVSVTLNEAETQMEVDTGATLSIISKSTYSRLCMAEGTCRPPH